MKAQWENKIMSSMLHYVDHKICSKGQAYLDHSGTFYPIDSRYGGYYTYALPFKQIVGDASIGMCSGADTISTNETDCEDSNVNGGAGVWTSATIMQGVSIDGNYTTIGNNDFEGILYHKGQVLFSADKSANTITGNFAVKEYNVYISTKLEEDILFKTKHQANPRINQNAAGLKNEEETFPAIFLKNMGGTNDPIALGSLAANVKTFVRAVVLSDSVFSLDAVCNILKDTDKNHVPIIDSLPFNSIGAFTGVIYNYQDLSDSVLSGPNYGTIWNVTVTKLMPDTKELQGLDWNVFAALIDFEIHGFGKNA